jgi:biopolymer transport protein ExbB
MQELVQNAGITAYPLVICSVLALGIILERLYALWRLRQQEDQAFWALLKSLKHGDDAPLRDPALAPAPVAHMIEALLPLRGESPETLMQAADIALSLQRLRLRRYLGTLATIGSTAPFVGLFGTVLGIMDAFHEMSRVGLSGEKISGGIAEALSATALGLLVAVPSVIAYNYFTGRVQALLLHVQGHVARLAPLLEQRAAPVPAAERPKVEV